MVVGTPLAVSFPVLVKRWWFGLKRTTPLVRHSCILTSSIPVRQLLLTVVALVALRGAPSNPVATQPTPNLPLSDLEAQVEGRYNSAKTLSVDFTESYDILGHRRPPETGTLVLRKVGKMRWDYRQPQGKLFVSDGKTVYLFTARDNRVEKVALKTTDDMRAPLAFLLGKLDLKKEFRDMSTRTADRGTWLLAQSRTDRLPYQSIEMLVAAGGRIEQLLVRGRDGSITSYQFENERLNPPVNDALFHFQIPAGAQVVDAMDVHSEGDR